MYDTAMATSSIHIRLMGEKNGGIIVDSACNRIP